MMLFFFCSVAVAFGVNEINVALDDLYGLVENLPEHYNPKMFLEVINEFKKRTPTLEEYNEFHEMLESLLNVDSSDSVAESEHLWDYSGIERPQPPQPTSDRCRNDPAGTALSEKLISIPINYPKLFADVFHVMKSSKESIAVTDVILNLREFNSPSTLNWDDKIFSKVLDQIIEEESTETQDCLQPIIEWLFAVLYEEFYLLPRIQKQVQEFVKKVDDQQQQQLTPDSDKSVNLSSFTENLNTCPVTIDEAKQRLSDLNIAQDTQLTDSPRLLQYLQQIDTGIKETLTDFSYNKSTTLTASLTPPTVEALEHYVNSNPEILSKLRKDQILSFKHLLDVVNRQTSEFSSLKDISPEEWDKIKRSIDVLNKKHLVSKETQTDPEFP
jgi:hypothetical protein